MLNPVKPNENVQRLPGEEFHDVGQNPKVGSSIRATQHTQICKSTIQKYPVYQLSNKPIAVELLKATLDVVQVGSYPDSIFVKLLTQDPVHREQIRMLCGLRDFMLQHSIGGPTEIDFNVKAIPDGKGQFVITFTPVAQLVGPESCTTNPDTGETSDQYDLPVSKIDYAKGGGHFMVMSILDREKALRQGSKAVANLYDFCRKKNAREVVNEYFHTTYGLNPF
eukprot:NODE_6530_length_874_cov_59.675100_g5935_i0.p1 GENE.NODE_6530_length_874_cov_59.675100_g5935_i0~~NODE_6530_length_874_cov_59.675100_g5935_i0.p1  ORF type:complete len:244 (+),score=51.60 NODE_6530_length_874_cov_59.675100_g5935_i0:64-732(+)